MLLALLPRMTRFFAFRLHLKAVDGIVFESFEDDVGRIFGHHAVDQSTHGNDFGVGFLFRATDAQHKAKQAK